MLENVGPDGELVDCIEGRQLNPGHAIECGWFMLEHAEEVKDEELRDLSLQARAAAPPWPPPVLRKRAARGDAVHAMP